MIIQLKAQLHEEYKAPNVICIEGDRRSGKTTKLLTYAIAAISLDKKVVLITSNHAQAISFEQSLLEKEKLNFVSFSGKQSEQQLTNYLIHQLGHGDLSDTVVLIDDIEYTSFADQEVPQFPELMIIYSKGIDDVYE